MPTYHALIRINTDHVTLLSNDLVDGDGDLTRTTAEVYNLLARLRIEQS